MEKLGVPFILGKKFLAKHSAVLLEYGGPGDILQIPAKPNVRNEIENKSFTSYSDGCLVSAMKVTAPSPFSPMCPDVSPIACPSRRYNIEDAEFIRSEVKRMFDAGVTEPSQSPWRAQTVVVKNRKKRRLVRLLPGCISVSDH